MGTVEVNPVLTKDSAPFESKSEWPSKRRPQNYPLESASEPRLISAGRKSQCTLRADGFFGMQRHAYGTLRQDRPSTLHHLAEPVCHTLHHGRRHQLDGASHP